MPGFRHIAERDDPAAIAVAEGTYRDRVVRALATALKRAARSQPVVRAVLSSATVRGRFEDLKAAVVTFTAPPFRTDLHHFYRWDYLDDLSSAELASEVSRVARADIARARGSSG
ncbi:MAG TPA: hypothetical protein VMT19_04105 [Thermoanaerobaculaceae bacterium]|nr:hypothetical protein [Thermoanaerobaculaceae bacterium]